MAPVVFHVEYPRVLPARRPPDYTPRAPRYSLRWREPVASVVADYVGIQRSELPWPEQRAFLDRIGAAFDHPDGPAAHEFLRCTDDAGFVNAIVVAYWTDSTAHARWSAHSEAMAWFRSADRLTEAAGYWRETIAVGYERLETIYSRPDYRIGLGRTPDTVIEGITTNGYPGAARDRLPISAVDELASPWDGPPVPRPVRSAGRRLRAVTPHNMAALRSGQYWAGAGPEQLTDYVENLEPKLLAGMSYLVENKEKSGTLALRIMRNIDEAGGDRAETSVAAYFLSLAHLEGWAASHPTHEAIYEHAIEMALKYGDRREVVTWHELMVLPSCATFEYVNCHPETGLLPYAELVFEEVER